MGWSSKYNNWAEQSLATVKKNHALFCQFEKEIDAAKDEDICAIYKRYCAEYEDCRFGDFMAPQDYLKSEMERRLYLAKLAYFKRKE